MTKTEVSYISGELENQLKSHLKEGGVEFEDCATRSDNNLTVRFLSHDSSILVRLYSVQERGQARDYFIIESAFARGKRADLESAVLYGAQKLSDLWLPWRLVQRSEMLMLQFRAPSDTINARLFALLLESVGPYSESFRSELSSAGVGIVPFTAEAEEQAPLAS